jgi:hypothetical protein
MTDLIRSLSLDALFMRRAALIESILELRTGYLRMQERRCALFGGETAEARLSYDLTLEWTRTRREFGELEQIQTAIARVDAACWSEVLARTGLEQMMDQQARAEWRTQLDELTMPAFTEANVLATFTALAGQRDEIFERGILNVFRKLSWNYKTNDPVRFGKRLVVTYACEHFTRRTKAGKLRTDCYGPTHTFAAKLDDLVRVFSVLDGKPEPASDQGAWALLRRQDWMTSDSDATTKDAELHGYLRFRGFKNGNAHITFLRLDLIDELNRILAKHYPAALPPAREAA